MGDYYDSSFEQQCPQCKTTKYRNPQMKLMVNVCGHALCDSCVKLLFIKESGECPECDMVLKRSKFRVQVFEDPLVEKEIDIRRRVMKVFVKQEEDFEKVEAWNTYLEEIEELVYDLVNDQNKPEAEKKLEYYEKQNKEDIRKSYSKRSKEEEELERLVEEEKLRQIERKRIEKEEEEKAKISKLKIQSSLLSDLMASEGDASLIVKSHAERLRLEQDKQREEDLQQKVQQRQTRTLQFSSGIKFGLASQNHSMEPLPIIKEVVYVYEPPSMPNCLQAPPNERLEEEGYLNHVRKASPQANAGGYTENYACLRALQEFMWGHVLSS
ncbi:UNVERIFIED_CONTAM: hypothetical protein GTU68_021644 [Idotea baltica]|nr:hypothetical protein [Idotea baltica]